MRSRKKFQFPTNSNQLRMWILLTVILVLSNDRGIHSALIAVNDQYYTDVSTPLCIPLLNNDITTSTTTVVTENPISGFINSSYPPFYLSNATTLIIEAENYQGSSRIRYANWYDNSTEYSYWQNVSSTMYSDTSGTGAVRTWPNVGVTTTTNQYGPALLYNVAFQTAGSYSVWARGRNCYGCLDGSCPDCLSQSLADDVIHYLYNTTQGSFTFGSNGTFFGSFSNDTWVWIKNLRGMPVTTLDVVSWPPKIFQFYLAMRRDGAVVDKLALTNAGTNFSNPGVWGIGGQGSPQSTFINCSSREILYFPPKSWVGMDSFNYTISDGVESSKATVFLYVGTPVPSPSTTPSSTPSCTPSTSPSATPTSSPSTTPSRSPTPTSSVTPSGSPTPSTTPSITPTASITPSTSSTPSITPSISPSASPSMNVTQTEKSNTQTIIIGSAAGVVGLTVFAFGGAVVFLLRRQRKMKEKKETELPEIHTHEKDNLSNGSLWIDDVYKPMGTTVSGYSSTSKLSRKSAILQSWMIDFNDLRIEQRIGKGAFGEVYKAKWKGVDVAVKRVMVDKDEVDIQDFFAEAELMKTLRPHPNLTQLMGVCDSPICIITEYVHNGSLSAWIYGSKPMDDDMKLNIAKGIVTGMLYLHSEGVIHRDLAARNILLTQSLQPKVCDFGMSRITLDDHTNKTSSDIGPIRWMAPEALSERLYNTKTDVWSFGVVVYEILTRKIPFTGVSLIHVAANVVSGKLSLLPEIRDAPENLYPAVLVKVVKLCLNMDPKKRPEFSNIMKVMQGQTIPEENSVSDSDSNSL